MITKERLEELIKQGATIYENRNEHILEISFDNADIRLGYKVQGIYLTFGDQESIIIAKIENLFETEEEAEWYLEFGDVTRNERLSLPTFEEFCELDDLVVNYRFEFTSEDGEIYDLYSYKCLDDVYKTIVIWNRYETDMPIIFEEKLTKENYIEACRLCKKLFLGEEV